MKDIFFVVTVPHTGTRSLMNVVDKNGYVSLSRLLAGTKEARKNKNRGKIVSSLAKKTHHIYLGEYAIGLNYLKSKNLYKGIEKDPILRDDVTNVIHGHIGSDTIDATNFLKQHTRIITTCRDPLLTLISVNQRDKKKPIGGNPDIGTSVRMSQMFEAWYLWAKYIYPAKPFIIPIDRKQDKLMYSDFDFSVIYNINVTANKEGYPLRTAYEKGDLSTIKQELGDNYDCLLTMKPLLQPILEDIGYSELLWWK